MRPGKGGGRRSSSAPHEREIGGHPGGLAKRFSTSEERGRRMAPLTPKGKKRESGRPIGEGRREWPTPPSRGKKIHRKLKLEKKRVGEEP